MTTDGVVASSRAAADPGDTAVGEDARIEVDESIGGIQAEALISRFGSPLYVYDLDALERRVRLLLRHLPERARLAYAVKANASPAIVESLIGLGVGADVASGGELRMVTRAGVAPADVVFTGPGKTDAELEAALRVGVGALTIESLDELEAVISMADLATAGQGLMFRLATSGVEEATTIISGDANAKFGLTDAEADEGVEMLAAAGMIGTGAQLRLRGLHAFGASNVLDADTLADGVVDLASRAESLATRHGLAFDLLDGGGGLGIPYAADEVPLDVAALGQRLGTESATWSGRTGLQDAQLLLEPGRWLVGPIGAYICSVVRSKRRGDGIIAVTDGGIHHLLRPLLVGQDHRVVPAGAAATRESTETAAVVGPLCTGLDLLARSVPSPIPRHGDLFAVLDVGAYGYAESMPFFLTHPIPAEVVVTGGASRISRERVDPA